MMSNHGMLVPLSGLFQKQADKEPGQRGNNDVAANQASNKRPHPVSHERRAAERSPI